MTVPELTSPMVVLGKDSKYAPQPQFMLTPETGCTDADWNDKDTKCGTRFWWSISYPFLGHFAPKIVGR